MIPEGRQRRLDLLLVDDSASDARLVEEALRESGSDCRVSVARDGEVALAFLRREAPFTDAPRPDLVLLDLNLPRKDGRELLAEIRRDPDLRRMPVVVLTTSRMEEDILSSYELGANACMVKPVGIDRFFAVIRAIHDFWLAMAALPSGR